VLSCRILCGYAEGRWVTLSHVAAGAALAS
jgi:hypothetical protein